MFAAASPGRLTVHSTAALIFLSSRITFRLLHPSLLSHCATNKLPSIWKCSKRETFSSISNCQQEGFPIIMHWLYGKYQFPNSKGIDDEDVFRFNTLYVRTGACDCFIGFFVRFFSNLLARHYGGPSGRKDRAIPEALVHTRHCIAHAVLPG